MKLANVESCYYFSPEDAEVEVIDWELVGGLKFNLQLFDNGEKKIYGEIKTKCNNNSLKI